MLCCFRPRQSGGGILNSSQQQVTQMTGQLTPEQGESKSILSHLASYLILCTTSFPGSLAASALGGSKMRDPGNEVVLCNHIRPSY